MFQQVVPQYLQHQVRQLQNNVQFLQQRPLLIIQKQFHRIITLLDSSILLLHLHQHLLPTHVPLTHSLHQHRMVKKVSSLPQSIYSYHVSVEKASGVKSVRWIQDSKLQETQFHILKYSLITLQVFHFHQMVKIHHVMLNSTFQSSCITILSMRLLSIQSMLTQTYMFGVPDLVKWISTVSELYMTVVVLVHSIRQTTIPTGILLKASI